jgi:hypothetical protein
LPQRYEIRDQDVNHNIVSPTPNALDGSSCQEGRNILRDEQIIVPTMRIRRAPTVIGLRPKICDKEAMIGWKTMLLRKYELPIQTAWTDVAFMALETIYSPYKQACAKQRI